MEPTQKPTTPPVFMGKPRDKSLEAYKSFVADFVKAVGGNTDSTMSEEKWKADWEAFWKE